jgi:hypothetical protein
MTTTGLSIFDKTLQETNVWLKGLMDILYTDDRHAAYVVLPRYPPRPSRSHWSRERSSPGCAASDATARAVLRRLAHGGYADQGAQEAAVS